MTGHSDGNSVPFHPAYVTPPLLSIGGKIKVEPEDFVVEEIPAYLPSGTGEHLFLWIQKRDVSAEGLTAHLAEQLGIPRDEVGMAGLKDRWAVTRQWVSVPASCLPLVSKIDNDSIRVLDSRLHENKLKTGHLLGNRFEILVRHIAPDAGQIAEQIRQLILKSGIPNYFGDQRFGTGRQTLTLGMNLLKGTASPRDIPFKRRKFLTRLALSAAQSALFNAVLQQRVDDALLNQVFPGDVMQVTASGGLFVVEDAATEQPRFDRREINLTGPLFGPKMKSPEGEIFQRELRVLQASGLTRDAFRAYKKVTPGGRRPLLIFPENFTVEHLVAGVKLCFSLPSGAYATVVLQEFMKGASLPTET